MGRQNVDQSQLFYLFNPRKPHAGAPSSAPHQSNGGAGIDQRSREAGTVLGDWSAFDRSQRVDQKVEVPGADVDLGK